MEFEKKRTKIPEAMEEDDMDEVSKIKAVHNEESMKFARRSVTDGAINKYQAFAQKMHWFIFLFSTSTSHHRISTSSGIDSGSDRV